MSFYLRSRLLLHADALHVTTPRTILGLVPIGTCTWDIPIERLAGVRTTVVVRIERVLAAAALLAVAIFTGLPWLATVALAAVAAILLFLGVALGMRFEERDGGKFTVPVCVLQRGVAAAALRQIERAIAGRSDP